MSSRHLCCLKALSKRPRFPTHSFDYLRSEAKSGRMGACLMAIVAEGDRGRVYLAPTSEHEAIAEEAEPKWTPDTNLPGRALGFRVQEYGMIMWRDLFTPRQLVALTTFSDLVAEAMERVKRDYSGLRASRPGRGQDTLDMEGETPAYPENETPLRDGGAGATAYAEAVGVYLAFAVDRCCDFSNSCTRWVPGNQKVMGVFGKQAIPMTWDFSESSSSSRSSWRPCSSYSVYRRVSWEAPTAWKRICTTARCHDQWRC